MPTRPKQVNASSGHSAGLSWALGGVVARRETNFQLTATRWLRLAQQSQHRPAAASGKRFQIWVLEGRYDYIRTRQDASGPRVGSRLGHTLERLVDRPADPEFMALKR